MPFPYIFAVLIEAAEMGLYGKFELAEAITRYLIIINV